MAPVQLHPCGLGCSFFRLIDLFWKGAWPAITLHRICTLMRKMGAQTVVAETPERTSAEWPRLDEELHAIDTRAGRHIPAEIVKLTFLTPTLENPSELSKQPHDAFLGCAIIINLQIEGSRWFSYVFESVLREPGLFSASPSGGSGWKPLFNNYLHVKRAFCLRVAGGNEYTIRGSYFCQQNGITSVCAHACAAMVLNNCGASPTIVTCEDVNKILGIDHKKRRLQSFLGGNDHSTHEGLTSMELETVFRSFGLSSYRHSFLDENRRLYRDFIYGFVESGYPAVLCFTTTSGEDRPSQHVVAVFGHTLNSDSWFPPAFVDYAGKESEDKPYLSTLDWVSDFIVHDDNFGMYFCLPGHSFRPEGHPDPEMDFLPVEGIGVYPAAASVRMHGYVAEGLGFVRLAQIYDAFVGSRSIPKQTYYLDHLLRHIQLRTVVARAVLVTPTQYLEHLDNKDCEGNALSESHKKSIRALITNQGYVWLVEFTEPDLYVGNKSKVVDVVLDPTIQLDRQTAVDNLNLGVLLVRFPGFLLSPQGQDYRIDDMGFSGHLPLFTLDKGRPRDTAW